MSERELPGPSQEMIAAVIDLWRLKPPGPPNLFADRNFLRLRDCCASLHPYTRALGFNSALATALRALGLPCSLSKDAKGLPSRPEDVAYALHAAFLETHSKKLHLIPMDLADRLPPLTFGRARLGRFTPNQLRELFNEEQLRRTYPKDKLGADRFAEFQWLVVEETVEFEQDKGARVLPDLLIDFGQDLGRIEPHEGRHSGAIEAVLFFLLLAPWEDWAAMLELDWRGFQVPWVHTVDSDIFVRRATPPSPDSLNWTIDIFPDGYGGEIEEDVPLVRNLDLQAVTDLVKWDQRYWEIVGRARNSVLFETPIVHFFTRAFFADGIDEFLAHLIAIEAALGLHADYDPARRVSPDRHKRIGATRRMRHRVSGLLGKRTFGDQFDRLFNIRSAFLHGRPMGGISSEDRVNARSLARRVACAVIDAATTGSFQSREDYLDDLLDAGLQLP
ncbi:hypothetical protein [Rhizobium leguminosarum]|uniref:hypothetical protein n=1 Tax=Rhizobium leguminosarum TaxID=384 RepID=UPI0003746B73|nr:hypothetical protein [Rhizobium leguminosarum]